MSLQEELWEEASLETAIGATAARQGSRCVHQTVDTCKYNLYITRAMQSINGAGLRGCSTYMNIKSSTRQHVAFNSVASNMSSVCLYPA